MVPMSSQTFWFIWNFDGKKIIKIAIKINCEGVHTKARPQNVLKPVKLYLIKNMLWKK